MIAITHTQSQSQSQSHTHTRLVTVVNNFSEVHNTINFTTR